MQLLAKTFRGLEDILAKELARLGAQNIKTERRAVAFSGDLALLYRANMCCRTASRILKPITTFQATTPDEVYEHTKAIDWEQFMRIDQTFAIDATVYSDTFRHSQFVSYRVKDAIADNFMERHNRRPSVRVTNPDILINVHISHNQCTISLDSSGESLHKRGYRQTQTEAPINEALAAGMILMTGFSNQCNFIDPMCGSGTFLIEAALIALNIPPGVYRQSFAFEKWSDFDKELFDTIYNDDSQERPYNFKIYGSDISHRAIQVAQENIRSAGLSKYIELKQCPIADFELPNGPALMVTNPPYGERLVSDNLMGLYAEIGTVLKHRCPGINAWIISSEIDCLQHVGLKPASKTKLNNGALDCEFWKFNVFAGKRNDFIANKKL